MTGHTSQGQLRYFSCYLISRSVKILRAFQVLKPYKLCQLYTVCHNISLHLTQSECSQLWPEKWGLWNSTYTVPATRGTSSLERSFMGNQRIFFPAQHQIVAVGNNKFPTISPLLAWCPTGSQVEKWPSIHFTLSKGKASGLVSQSKIRMHQVGFEMVEHYFWRLVEILLAHRLSTSC